MQPVGLLQLLDLVREVGVDEEARFSLLEHLLDLGLDLQVPHEVQVVLEDGIGPDVLPLSDVDDPLPVSLREVLEREVKMLEVGRVDSQPPAERSSEWLLAVRAGQRAELVGEEYFKPVGVAVSEDEDWQANSEIGDELPGGEVRNSFSSDQQRSGEPPLTEHPLLQKPLEDRVLLHHENIISIDLPVQIRNVLDYKDEM